MVRRAAAQPRRAARARPCDPWRPGSGQPTASPCLCTTAGKGRRGETGLRARRAAYREGRPRFYFCSNASIAQTLTTLETAGVYRAGPGKRLRPWALRGTGGGP